MISRIVDRWRAMRQAGDAQSSPAINSADRFQRRLTAIGEVILRHRWTPLLTVIATIIIHLLLREVVFPRHDPLDVATRACAAPGEWFDLATADVVDQSRLMREIAGRPIILLGKTGTADLDEGRWLGFSVAAIYSAHRNVVIALDGFPPSQQPVLDRWVQGEIEEADLISTLDWRAAYTLDPQSYVPLFRLARLYRVPLLAIGMDTVIAEHLLREDWASVPVLNGRRDRPVEPPEGYRRSLAALHLAEQLSEDEATRDRDVGRLIFSEELTPILVSDGFRRFMQARRAEDWLLAHRLIAARQRSGRPLVVGIIARNHLEYGWGVPSQLAAISPVSTAILLPFAGSGDCGLIRPGVADAVFILQPGPSASVSAALPRPEPIIGRVGGPAASKSAAP